jgi:hypothetical protein
VTDALVFHHRAGSLRNDEFPVRVYLEPNKSSKDHSLPWKAVIISQSPRSIAEVLRPINEWLGIQIEIAEPLKMKKTNTSNRPDICLRRTGNQYRKR